jgi:phage terminase large subunit
MSTSPDVRKWCVNWRDNPFFPEVLEKERLRKFYNDPEGYANVWEGALITNGKASIFKDHYKVEDFTPTTQWGYPLYGMDFGYSNDPTTLVKCYLHNDTIYIEKSAGKVNLDINDIARYFFDEFGEDLSRTSISADCSQPMTIEYLRTHGLSGIHACQKWQGSIIDGISWLKSFGKMVVHSKATGVIDNLRLYSNKVDLRNDKVLNEPKDANNDYIDALRYAFDRIIKTNGSYWHLFDKIGDDF